MSRKPEPTTKPIPRAELAPIATAPDEGEETKVRCPTCAGAGCITAEQYAALEADAKRRDEQK